MNNTFSEKTTPHSAEEPWVVFLRSERRRPLLPPAPMLPLALCLMAGIMVGSRGYVSPETGCALLAALVAVALPLWRFPLTQSTLIRLSVAALGLTLSAAAERDIARREAVVEQLASEGEAKRGTQTFQAVVASQPSKRQRSWATDIIRCEDGIRLRCYLRSSAEPLRLRPGDGLTLSARIERSREWRDSHFNYSRYLSLQGISGQCFVDEGGWQREQVTLAGLSRLERARLRFLRARSHILERMKAAGIGGDEYGVLAAMTLGDKSSLSREQRELYSATGAAHILALSGLHLGIIYMLFSLLIRRRRWRRVVLPITVVCLWMFAFLTGLSASVVRSSLMISAYALLTIGERRKMSLGVLAFCAFAMLVASPLSLYDLGFQLSFLSMLGIMTIEPLLESAVSPRFLQNHRLARWVWSMLCVSAAAQVTTAPLVAYTFGRLPLYFMLTNFIVVPAAWIILSGTLIAVVVPWTPLMSALGWVVAQLNGALRLCSRLPLASIDGLHPTLMQTAMTYVVIAASYFALLLWLRARRGAFA